MLQKLKKAVESQFGRKVLCAKDCQSLASSILERTSERLSDSTLRRFWGLLSGTTSPTTITLDILSRYSGCQCWEHFKELHGVAEVKKLESQASLWINAKINGDEVTSNTISFIYKKSGVVSSDIIGRQCIDDFVKVFFESKYVATSLIAPAGYGKSLGVASWIERNLKKKNYSNYLFYFLNGRHVDATYQQGMSIESWIQAQLFKSQEADLNEKMFLNGAKIVLIIDALDEIESTQVKAKTFFSKLIDFITLEWVQKYFKILITTRTSIWERDFVHEILGNEAAVLAWMGIDNFYTYDDYTNLPALNRNEIQHLLNIGIVKKQQGPKILMEQLSFSLQETLSHPYMLKLFIAIYNTNTLWVQNSNDVIDEFINREIASSRYAAEKIDIISFILEKQEYGKNLIPVKKNDLKEVYPVHLRKSGNYFYAYEHLLAYNILTEETVLNRFKNLVSQVDFTHGFLRDLLITRKLVEDNNGVTLNLFKKIDKEYAQNEIRTQLITNAYSTAYADNNFEALAGFFELPSPITSDKNIQRAILNQFRNDKPIRNLLIRSYVKNPESVKFLMSSNFEFDSISTSFYKILEEMLEKASTLNEKIYCNAGLALAKILIFDVESFDIHSKFLETNRPDRTCSQNTLLAWSIWKLMYLHVKQVENKEEVIRKDLYAVNEVLKSNSALSSNAVLSFFTDLLPFTFVFRSTVIADQIIEFIDGQKEQMGGVADPNLQKTMDLYISFRHSIDDKDYIISSDRAFTFEQDINNTASKHRYVSKIVAYLLLSRYYLYHDDQAKFTFYYQIALEICSHANYKLVEVALLKHLALILDGANLSGRSNECLQFAASIYGERDRTLFDIL